MVPLPWAALSSTSCSVSTKLATAPCEQHHARAHSITRSQQDPSLSLLMPQGLLLLSVSIGGISRRAFWSIAVIFTNERTHQGIVESPLQ